MSRSFYRELARRGLRLPLAADLFLHQEPEPARARLDGIQLGRVIERAARPWTSPTMCDVMHVPDAAARNGLEVGAMIATENPA